MAGSTRKRLVEAASRRFYRDGFRNVGIDQILTDVGITKTAFYKHFDSKEDLVLEVLHDQDEWLRDTFNRLVHERGGDDPVDRLRALFGVVEDLIESPDYRGCFFVNVAMEFPLSHDPAHVAAARNKTAIHEMVQGLAQAAGAADPAGLADDLCLVMEGAYVTRQVTGNTRTSAIAKRVADRIIDGYLQHDSDTRPA